jgi:hypothetical protein
MFTKYHIILKMFLIVVSIVATQVGTIWAGTIAASEYFIDTDPGEGSGTALSASDGAFDSALENVAISLNTSNLTIGVHNLFIRMKNDAGVWGTPRKVPFNIDGNQYIAAQEYYFDTDPGVGTGTPLTAVDGIFDQKWEQGTAVLNTSSLTAGLHALYVRAKNAEGHWGTPRQYTIEIINQPTVMGMEYYVDSDPGTGHGSAMASTDGSFSKISQSASATLNTTNLSAGTHTIYVRAENSFSIWGAAQNVNITVAAQPVPSQVSIISPTNAATIVVDSLNIIWSKVTSIVDKYCLELASDSLFATKIFSDSTITDTTKICKGLTNKTTYWFHVMAHNSSGWGSFSDARKFTVNISTTAVLPKAFSFKFSGLSASNSFIRYSLPKACNVSFRLFNVQGKLIRTFINAEQSSGYYQIPLNIADLSRGCYLMDFKAGSFTVKRKMNNF